MEWLICAFQGDQLEGCKDFDLPEGKVHSVTIAVFEGFNFDAWEPGESSIRLT